MSIKTLSFILFGVVVGFHSSPKTLFAEQPEYCPTLIFARPVYQIQNAWPISFEFTVSSSAGYTCRLHRRYQGRMYVNALNIKECDSLFEKTVDYKAQEGLLMKYAVERFGLVDSNENDEVEETASGIGKWRAEVARRNSSLSYQVSDFWRAAQNAYNGMNEKCNLRPYPKDHRLFPFSFTAVP